MPPFEQLGEVCAAEVERAKLPGLAIALVRGDEIAWSRGYGYADLASKRPVTSQTVFAIQSVTKPIMTTAFMQWVERGRVCLDDAVNDHLAPLRLQSEWPVTLRQLLTHTSGLPVDMAVTSPESEKTGLEQFIGDVAKTVRPPGEEMVYANWGYDIIGYLLGRFAGRPYPEALHEQVLDPLEMVSSSIEAPAGMATGYYLSALDGQHYQPAPVYWDTDPPRPCGALYSTVEDLGRFLIAHLNGGEYNGHRILQPETVAEMHRLHSQWGKRPAGMGLGFRVDRVGSRPLICHGGDGVTFTAAIAAYPEEQVGVALLINMGRAPAARSTIMHAALAALVGDEPATAPSPAPIPDGLAGRYVSNFWGIDATLRSDDGVPVLDVEGGIVTGESERSQLVFKNDVVARAHDGPFAGFELAFEPAHDGEPARFYGGIYPFRFDWQADAPVLATIDEQANVGGAWQGSVASPFGPVPVTLRISDGAGTITTMSAHDQPLEQFAAKQGRVEGETAMSVPGLGDFRVYLRLAAIDGRLRDRVYARGTFGETPMRAELERADG